MLSGIRSSFIEFCLVVEFGIAMILHVNLNQNDPKLNPMSLYLFLLF